MKIKSNPNNKINNASYYLNIPKKQIYNNIYNIWLKQNPIATNIYIFNTGYLQTKRRYRHYKPPKYNDSNYTARKLQLFYPILNIWGNKF